MSNKNIFILVLILLVAGIVVLALVRTPAGPGKYDEFAQCLGDQGATFYGAFWCPHCQDQKKAFGSSARLLPYIECSTADGRGQLAICRDAGIEGYPTWEFADGSRLNGEVPLTTLAEKTSCELPSEE